MIITIIYVDCNRKNYLFKYGWRTRKMKTKLLIILILAGAAMVGPVAAVDATSTITGNITPYISLAVTGGSISGWSFVTGPNTNSSTVTLLLTCNYPGWTITAADALNPGVSAPAKPTGSRGAMAQSLASGEYKITDPHYWLHTNMGITGTSSAGQYTADGAPPQLLNSDGTALGIYHGEVLPTGTGTFANMPIEINQLVTVADSVLPTDNLYKIIVTFTALIP
jgi:hypothetical protein